MLRTLQPGKFLKVIKYFSQVGSQSFNLKDLYLKSRDRLEKIQHQTTDEISKFVDRTNTSLNKIGTSLSERTLVGVSKLDQSRIQLSINVNNTGETIKRFLTKTGRKIVANKDKIIIFGAGAAVGISGAVLFQQMYADNPEILSEFEDQREIINEYTIITDLRPNDMELQDWRTMTANVSANLKTQLKFQLGVAQHENKNLFELLNMASQEDILSNDELHHLHEFRTVRNSLIHNADVIEFDTRPIIWTSQYVRNF